MILHLEILILQKTTKLNRPTLAEIDQYIGKFIGKHTQVPPQFSAVKVNGKRAYKLARSNQKFELKAKELVNPCLF